MAFGEKLKDWLWGFKKNKKAQITLLVLGLLIIVSLAGVFVFKGMGIYKNENKNTNTEGLIREGDKARRFIDGSLVAIPEANLYPIGVMIENLPAARPQSALIKANLVYEALSEGGITRFLAFYATSEAISEIGPVRSARSYYLDWAKELNALYAHIGGSPQAIVDIKKYDIFDLNQFFNSQYFWRAKTVPAPHNVFTSSKLLVLALRDKQAAEMGNYKPWLFKDDAVLDERPTEAKTIKIDFSSFSYQVEYQYQKESNEYLRLQAGAPHLDKSGTQIKAKNVVVQFVKTRLADEQRLAMETTGEGEALVFLDGSSIVAKWSKQTREDRTRFYHKDNGEEIEFNAGTTWVEIVPSDRQIEYN